MALSGELLSPKRWRQLKTIFEEAVKLASAEREAFLERACQDDESLRSSVESMLSSDEQAWSLFDQPAFAAAAGLFAEEHVLLPPGEEIGHYQVLGLLGRGGMGEVYLAEDQRLGRRIALKVLPTASVGNERQVERFRQEARAASALNHPNIVTIYEISQAGERHYIATEFIDGETLRQRLRRGVLEMNEVLDVATQVANALSAAHLAGIVHRDIKPENIMLRPDGYVKVLDFGLAKLIEPQPPDRAGRQQSERGSEVPPMLLMGTTSYMSPEQARGLETDARSDIFSFGVVLYEMVAGRKPFAASDDEDPITAMLSQDPAPLNELAPVPDQLQRIINKALRKDREERYQSSQALLEDLTRFRREEELQFELGRSTDLGVDRKLAQASGWSFWRRIALAVLILMLVATIVAIAYKSNRRPPSRPAGSAFQNVSLTKLASLGTVTRAALSADGEYVAYSLADKGRQSIGLLHIATSITKEILPPAEINCHGLTFTPDGQFIYYVDGLNPKGQLYRVATDGATPPTPLLGDIAFGVCCSPDGKQITFLRIPWPSNNNYLMTANADGSGERVLATMTMPYWFFAVRPAWSPDGKVIICPIIDYSGEAVWKLVEVQVADGSWRIIPDAWAYIPECEWLPDGSGLLMLARKKGEASIQLWHLSVTDSSVYRVTNDTVDYMGLSLSTDGHKVLALQSEALSYLWTSDFSGQNSKQITFAKSDGIGGVAWTPDDKLIFIAYTPGGGALYEVDADGSNRRQVTSADSAPRDFAVSLDGRYIVFTSEREGRSKLWRVNRDGSNPTPMPGAEGTQLPVFSADSQWIIFPKEIGEQWILYKMPVVGGEPVRLNGSRIGNFPRVSPDGQRLLYQDYDLENHQQYGVVIPINGGPELQRLALPAAVNLVTNKWTPDGKAVLYIDQTEGESQLWRLPLDGKPATPFNSFTSRMIYAFDWSTNNHKFVYAAGMSNTTLALITLEQ